MKLERGQEANRRSHTFQPSTHIDLVLEETNQYHGLLPLKDEFYVFARDRGERLMRRPSRHPAWNRGRLRGSWSTSWS